jgi:hypothetical protein
MEIDQFLNEATYLSEPMLALAESVPLEVGILMPFSAAILIMLFGCFGRLRPIK